MPIRAVITSRSPFRRGACGAVEKITVMGIGGHKLGLKFYGRVTELRNRLSAPVSSVGTACIRLSYTTSCVMCSCAIRCFPATGRCSVNCSRPGVSRTPRRAAAKSGDSLRLRHFWPESCGCGVLHSDAQPVRARRRSRWSVSAAAGNTVAVMSPYDGRERRAMCLQIVAAHPSTTVDNRGYLLVFNNNLPKQHFRI